MNELKIKKAFTLVELIIVITILVILATIAFVSFQNYTKDSRDANRLTTINNISKGLDVFQIKTGFYPEPESKTSFTGAGNKKLHQGIISDNITNTINLSEIPLDPKEKTNYIYSTYGDGKYYQIASEAENITSFLYNTTYAENKSSIVRGNYKFDPSLPSLIVITNSLTGSSIFDPKVCFVTNGGLNSITSNSGTCLKKEEMILNTVDNSLVGYWDMESLCNDVNCGNISNSGYIKNLATNDLNTLSGTVLKNHNNANYINKTFTGNSIMGKGSAYITDFDSALQTSDNIKNIEKNMTVSIMVKPNFTTNFDGNFGNTWNRNFFYDYYSDKIRFALLNEAIGVATYKNNNHYQLFAKGFNFEKDKTYILTTSQTITLSGESLNSQMNLYINGLKYKNYTSGNIKSGNSSYSLTGGVFHFGSSSNNPDACGTQASQFAQFNMVTQGCTFNGLIDEVKIYNRVLTDEEISQQARIAGF